MRNGSNGSISERPTKSEKMIAHDSAIFISYSQRDSTFADRLHDRLKSSGVRPWIDRLELRAGDSILSKLSSAVTQSQFMLVILSPHSVNSKWVKTELEIAMSVEVAQNRRFVIPLLYKDCQLPAFLKPKLYVDFRTKSVKQFERAFQTLLLSLDAMDRTEQSAEAVVHGDTFIDRIARGTDLRRSKWFRSFKQFPLAQDLERALALSSFGGQFQNDLLLGLATVSNSERGVGFSGFVALAGLVSDALISATARPDLYELIRRIAEDKNIDAYYRRHVVSKIPELYRKATERRDKLSILPAVFDVRSFDPVADEIVRAFLSAPYDSSSDLAKLWELDAPHYRREIVEYTRQTGVWKGPLDSKELHLSSDPNMFYTRCRTQWIGLHGDQLDAQVIAENEMWLQRLKDGHECDLSRVVGAYEQLFRSGSTTATKLMLDVLNKSTLDRLSKKAGRATLFKMLTDLVASRYVDWAVSGSALLELMQRFTIRSLQCDARFPGALVVRKSSALVKSTGPVSLVEGFAEAAVDDRISAMMLLGFIKTFPQVPFMAAVMDQCEKQKQSKKSRSIDEIMRFIRTFSEAAV